MISFQHFQRNRLRTNFRLYSMEYIWMPPSLIHVTEWYFSEFRIISSKLAVFQNHSNLALFSPLLPHLHLLLLHSQLHHPHLPHFHFPFANLYLSSVFSGLVPLDPPPLWLVLFSPGSWLRACRGWGDAGVARSRVRLNLYPALNFSAASTIHFHSSTTILLPSSCALAWPRCATLGSPPPFSRVKRVGLSPPLPPLSWLIILHASCRPASGVLPVLPCHLSGW